MKPSSSASPPRPISQNSFLRSNTIIPFPRKRESPYSRANLRKLQNEDREIPAFAGMGMRGRRKSPPTFHSGESRNLILATARIFREAEHCNSRLRRMRLCRRDSGFRRNGSSFNFAVPPLPFPRKRKSPPTFHSGESRNLILATARIFREAEHCNSRLWRMRLRRRDSGFRRNGSSLNFTVPPPLPFPRKRESPCHLTVLERDAKRQLEIRGDSRFRGNGNRWREWG